MNKTDVASSIQEAERFLVKAKAALKAQPAPRGAWESWEGGPLTSAMKRSSLDLTRALAKMRRL